MCSQQSLVDVRDPNPMLHPLHIILQSCLLSAAYSRAATAAQRHDGVQVPSKLWLMDDSAPVLTLLVSFQLLL
jgi:hypothetical protein